MACHAAFLEFRSIKDNRRNLKWRWYKKSII